MEHHQSDPSRSSLDNNRGRRSLEDNQPNPQTHSGSSGADLLNANLIPFYDVDHCIVGIGRSKVPQCQGSVENVFRHVTLSELTAEGDTSRNGESADGVLCTKQKYHEQFLSEINKHTTKLE